MEIQEENIHRMKDALRMEELGKAREQKNPFWRVSAVAL